MEAFLLCFAAFFPLVLSRFANGQLDSLWIGPVLAFVTVTSYTALHKVARALEDPFVHPPNDLPGNALQAAFNGRLLTTWDALRRPADAPTPPPPFGPSTPKSPYDVAYAQSAVGAPGTSPLPVTRATSSPAAPRTPGGDGNGSGSGTAPNFDPWGEYAYLEPEDVREQSGRRRTLAPSPHARGVRRRRALRAPLTRPPRRALLPHHRCASSRAASWPSGASGSRSCSRATRRRRPRLCARRDPTRARRSSARARRRRS